MDPFFSTKEKTIIMVWGFPIAITSYGNMVEPLKLIVSPRLGPQFGSNFLPGETSANPHRKLIFPNHSIRDHVLSRLTLTVVEYDVETYNIFFICNFF
jgi:hypothetical protein